MLLYCVYHWIGHGTVVPCKKKQAREESGLHASLIDALHTAHISHDAAGLSQCLPKVTVSVDM